MEISSNFCSDGTSLIDFLEEKTSLVCGSFSCQNMMNCSQTIKAAELLYKEIDDFKIIFDSLSLKIITGIFFFIVSTLKTFQDFLLIKVIHIKIC